jgi:plastocyanin
MKSIVKLASLSTIIVVCLVIFGCSKNSGYSNGGNTTSTDPNVSIKNFAFTVTTLKIGAGVTVKWTNNDGTSHTVTADDGSFNSGNIAPGASFTKKFNTKGTFAYHCSIHPMMTASVVVE